MPGFCSPTSNDPLRDLPSNIERMKIDYDKLGRTPSSKAANIGAAREIQSTARHDNAHSLETMNRTFRFVCSATATLSFEIDRIFQLA